MFIYILRSTYQVYTASVIASLRYDIFFKAVGVLWVLWIWVSPINSIREHGWRILCTLVRDKRGCNAVTVVWLCLIGFGTRAYDGGSAFLPNHTFWFRELLSCKDQPGIPFVLQYFSFHAYCCRPWEFSSGYGPKIFHLKSQFWPAAVIEVWSSYTIIKWGTSGK